MRVNSVSIPVFASFSKTIAFPGDGILIIHIQRSGDSVIVMMWLNAPNSPYFPCMFDVIYLLDGILISFLIADKHKIMIVGLFRHKSIRQQKYNPIN